ncbi:MAG: hypothetical protein P0Y56_01135 [Candidatus Andeanibacterium colombiense]|uniref:SMP-30/Gluconolactonase/LRE-like region domain-containing protein n=1 Tax=Candidatus Andeanibacterium colombiense TaxID=3121345 RepID=A0AAJ5X376_9SPHN|nr:MAG: hypothetical protein P0Y56_01135 [Sphingomonadaceae bacterium]
MTGKLLWALLPAALLLAGAARAEPPQWRPVNAATGQMKAPEDLALLAQDFPDSATVHLRLLNALAEAGDTEGAGKEALQLAVRGYAFTPASEQVLSRYLDIDYAQWLASAMQVNRRQIQASALLASLPAEAQLVESIARDPKTGDLYATTVVSRALYVKRGAGEWQRLDLPGAGSLSGIAYDPKAKLLWIASGNVDQTPGEKVKAALLGFDPATGTVVRRLETGGEGALGDVAAGDDGSIYASDPLRGIVYTAAPADIGLRVLVGPGMFRSPQGLVAVPGGKLLIVSDYRYGLAVLDIASGKASRLTAAKPALLDGIDGIWRNGRSLIAMQNGVSPKRIVKLDMAGDWRTIGRLTILESDHPDWSEPAGGTLDDGRLLYVATGQWDRFGEGGAPVDGTAPGATEIRALPLGK